jgi:hypothetical protein
VRVIGLLSWYQEPVPWLAELVASMGRAGIDHVVALDGAYMLYPKGQAKSEGDQADAIRRTAVGFGMGATIHVPQMPWLGNEVEKRDKLFGIGHAVAEPGDWLWVCDADEVIEQSPFADVQGVGSRIRHRLMESEHEVAEVMLRCQPDPQGDSEFFPIRKLFRVSADGPIRVLGRHDRYIGPHGEPLWVPSDGRSDIVPCEDMTEVHVFHRINQRPAARVLARASYYMNRDEAGIEA